MNSLYARYREDEAFRNALLHAAHVERAKAFARFFLAAKALLRRRPAGASRMLRRHTAFG